MVAIKIDAASLSTLPKRGRTKQAPRFAKEIAEAVEGFKTDPEALFAVEAAKDKAASIRQGLYSAAKEAGVKIRTWSLHEANPPQALVAYRVVPNDTPDADAAESVAEKGKGK